MSSLRFILALFVLLMTGQSVSANNGHRRASTEVRNELPMPTLSAQLQRTTHVIVSLQDALRLSQAQMKAFDACAMVALHDLALAATPADISQAQHRYLVSVGRLLTTSQFAHYLAMHPYFSDALLRIDGSEVAAR